MNRNVLKAGLAITLTTLVALQVRGDGTGEESITLPDMACKILYQTVVMHSRPLFSMEIRSNDMVVFRENRMLVRLKTAEEMFYAEVRHIEDFRFAAKDKTYIFSDASYNEAIEVRIEDEGTRVSALDCVVF